TFGTITQWSAGPTSATTTARSSRHHGVPTAFTRTARVGALHVCSRSAAATCRRVSSFFSSGATASSRSTKTSSAARPAALASIFGLEPGTARQERRRRVLIGERSLVLAGRQDGAAARARDELARKRHVGHVRRVAEQLDHHL